MNDFGGHRERLRAHFQEHGLDALRDYEVLELLLFYAIPRRDTQPIARDLLKHFGSLSAVFDASEQELLSVPGIGEHAAFLLKLIPPLSRRYQVSRAESGIILNNTKATGSFVVPYFHGESEEVLYLLCLDSKQKLIACKLLQRGTINTVQLPVRKAMEIVLNTKAAAVILAHNHPSGLAMPSEDDYYATNYLRDALSPLGVPLLDHVIVAEGEFFSLRDNGYVPNA